MGITDKLNHFFGSVQTGAKNTSVSLFLVSLKVITAFVLALTFSMVGQELSNYGTLSFVFVMVVVLSIFLKIMSKWNLGAVLVFDLICFLIALLLRMYILVAP